MEEERKKQQEIEYIKMNMRHTSTSNYQNQVNAEKIYELLKGGNLNFTP